MRRKKLVSIYNSDRCTKLEAESFKKEVLVWLRDNGFAITIPKKFKVFTCFGGDFRIYTGYQELENKRESFRRAEPTKNDKGEIIGWQGTRGHHTTKFAEYISINRDEWEAIKKSYEMKSGDDYEFNKDYIFSHLEKSL